MTDVKKVLIGGSFAPVITAEKLAQYKSLGEACANRRQRDYVAQLVTMLEVFWQTAESQQPTVPHATGLPMVPLEPDEVERIWDYVPWMEEIDVMAQEFDKLDPVTQKDLRNAAFHLVWYARELCNDREPITKEKVAPHL